MSRSHGKWSAEEIRGVIRTLDEKTGMDGASLSISLLPSIHSERGMVLGTYSPDSKVFGFRGVFSFSMDFLNAPDTRDLSVINCIRHEYCHYLVDVLDLKTLYGEEDPHGAAWNTVRGLLNTARSSLSVYSFGKGSPYDAAASEDIPAVNIPEQLSRWGLELPSVALRSRLEKELVRKYGRLRVFRPGGRVVHKKFGEGTVLDTMPDENKQFLYVRFDSGEERVVQNRQVYKLMNGQALKPAPHAE